MHIPIMIRFENDIESLYNILSIYFRFSLQLQEEDVQCTLVPSGLPILYDAHTTPI